MADRWTLNSDDAHECLACGWPCGVEPEAYAEPPIVKGALDAQERAERELATVRQELLDTRVELDARISEIALALQAEPDSMLAVILHLRRDSLELARVRAQRNHVCGTMSTDSTAWGTM